MTATAIAAVDDCIDVRRPTDGSLIETIALDDVDHVVAVARRLRRAQPEWEGLGIEGRSKWLARLRDWLLANTDLLADLLQAETGKVKTDARTEIFAVCDGINVYLRRGPGYLADEKVRPTLPLLKVKRIQVARRPYPLVGVIGPWNFPVYLTIGDAVPALLAGAAVILKPSEVTPLATRRIVQAWREDLGAPPILDLVIGGRETGEAVVEVSDFVNFTGSVRTGRAVAVQAAQKLTPVALELGGKDPMIVLRDANVARAANAAVWGGLINAGQACQSVERVYVEEPLYESFLAQLVEKVKALRQEPDDGVTTDVGAMISAAQVEIVEEHIAEAKAKGARVLTGGHRLERCGTWYQPTVIADVDHSMTIMREETFGPILSVMRVSDREEAVRLANDTSYGLSSTVFAGNARDGERVARRIDAGACNVNDVLVAAFCYDAPMVGWKQSGVGGRNGVDGIRKYTRPTVICSPRLPTLTTEPTWFPYTPRKQAAVEWVYRFVIARVTGRIEKRRR